MSTMAKTIKAVIIFIIALSLTLVTLFSGDDVTLDDNGDYGRIIRLCSLEKNDDGELKISLKAKSFSENVSNIFFTPKNVSTYPSSQLIFVRISVFLNYAINNISGASHDNYNIFYLGILMSIMYAFALCFLLSLVNIKNKYLNWIFILISLIIMCDIGYVSYFNSLYAEGIQHVLLIVLISFLILETKRTLKIHELVIFSITLIFYGESKFFNIPIAIIIGIIFLILFFKHEFKEKSFILHVASFLMCVVFLLGYMSSLPKWISKETNYNSVFYGIVKDCTDEEAKNYLEKDLKLDPQLYVLKNTNHYVGDFKEINTKYDIEDVKQISKLRLVLFYLKHPVVTMKKVSDIAQHSGVIRNIFFMNENHMKSPLKVTLWSKIRESSGFDTILLNLFIILLVIGFVIANFKKKKTSGYITFSIPILLIMIFAYSFIVPYISNGEADLAKHMYSFIEFIDISIIFIIASVLNSKRDVKKASLIIFAVVFIINNIPVFLRTSVSFGGYEWYVIDETDGYQTLISKDIISKKKFSLKNDNNYIESDIHRWLNDDFIKSFSEEEREKLLCVEEKIVLSQDDIKDATSGNREFYCSAFSKRAEANYDSAYSQVESGYVFLPSAKHISQMARNGDKVALRDKFWLSTPYFKDSKKVRYVNPDGFVYFASSEEELGIRPVIYIKTN